MSAVQGIAGGPPQESLIRGRNSPRGEAGLTATPFRPGTGLAHTQRRPRRAHLAQPDNAYNTSSLGQQWRRQHSRQDAPSLHAPAGALARATARCARKPISATTEEEPRCRLGISAHRPPRTVRRRRQARGRPQSGSCQGWEQGPWVGASIRRIQNGALLFRTADSVTKRKGTRVVTRLLKLRSSR